MRKPHRIGLLLTYDDGHWFRRNSNGAKLRRTDLKKWIVTYRICYCATLTRSVNQCSCFTGWVFMLTWNDSEELKDSLIQGQALTLRNGLSLNTFFLTLKALRAISIKFLLVISMLGKTEWWWELRTWSHKIDLLDILSSSPHHFCRKWIGATNENSNFDLRVWRVNRPFHNYFYPFTGTC